MIQLPMRKALQAWDAATSSERKALAPLMPAKRDRYFEQAYDLMTARDRARDPVLRRIRSEGFTVGEGSR